MDTQTAPGPRPDAFILTGSFLVVCRAPLYLAELARRGLKILLITPSYRREDALAAAKDPDHPAYVIDEAAFVDGDVSRDNSYLPGVLSVAPGATVHSVTSSWERAGLVVTTGADAVEAGRRAEYALSLIDVRTGGGAR
ncbi:hypothetical protein [Streptomyces bauhiniae]|uniref:L-amino acid ligase C-terminal domain-containing protein n=1 Tax=Streptomyces bauhiniae TaxID=2340725 RepID=A0A4Z1D279_9ACTN|nr:hypothetical protein [Streptomyces bauhiniae]TGN75603.1 hypothetical protein E5083_18215 [Streptomyces bauhiniae]